MVQWLFGLFTPERLWFGVQVTVGVGWALVAILFLACVWVVNLYVKGKEGFGSYDAWGKTILYDEQYRRWNEAFGLTIFLVVLVLYALSIPLILWMWHALWTM